jgi:nucleoid-associated protein YejK
MDRYDLLILDIIRTHRQQCPDRSRINLATLERTYWKAIESDKALSYGQGRIGERIARLYLAGYIENKNGYHVTRKGRAELEAATATLAC